MLITNRLQTSFLFIVLMSTLAAAGLSAQLAVNDNTYTENQTAFQLDAAGTFGETGSPTDYDTATLTVSFGGTGFTEDQLTVGAHAPVALNGSNVEHTSVAIGALVGGVNGADLVITFDANATTAAQIQDVIRAIEYLNNSDDPDTTARTLTFTLAAGGSGSAGGTDAMNLTVTAVNDVPTLVVNAGLTVAEASIDTQITTTELEYDDLDNSPAEIIFTVTSLTLINGTLELSNVALAVSNTFTQADINGGLVTYTHDGNEPATTSFDFSVEDIATGSGGSGTFTITVTPVNDAPVVTANTGVSVDEAAIGTVIIAAMLDASDPDNTPAELTYTLTGVPANGTLRLGGSALTTTSGSNTFTQADINANQVTYDHDGSETISDSFTFDLEDLAPSGPTGVVFSITVNPVNDPPVLSGINGAVRNWTENGITLGTGPVTLAGSTAITDVDNTDFNGGSLTVSLGGPDVTADVLLVDTLGMISLSGPLGVGVTVSHASLPIGTVSSAGPGNSLVIDFNTNDATLAAVIDLCDAILFDNVSDDPDTTNRTIGFVLNDGTDDSNTENVTVTVTETNDNPQLTVSASAITYIENASPLLIAASGTVSDPDSADFDTGILQVTYDSGATADDQLFVTPVGSITVTVAAANEVRDGATLVGTYPLAGAGSGVNGASVLITFNANATPAIAQLVLRALAFANSSDDPVGPPPRVVRFFLTDGDGGSSLQPTRPINVTPVNDAPTLAGATNSFTYTENDAATALTGASVAVDDLDDTHFGGGFLSATITQNISAANQLSVEAVGPISVTPGTPNLVFHGATLIGTFPASGAGSGVNGAPLMIALNANCFDAEAADLIEALAYANGSNDPNDTQDVLVDIVLHDGTDPSVASVVNITITAVNDGPTAIDLGGPLTVDEDTSGSVSFNFSDADIANAGGTGNARVTLSANDGVLTLASLTNLTFTLGDGTADASMDFFGPLADVAAAILTVTYTPNLNFYGADSVAYLVDDLGNYGTGGSLTDSLSVGITIDAINDAPDAGPSVALNPGLFTSLGTFNPSANVTVDTTALTMSGGASFTGVDAGGIAVFCFSDVMIASSITLNVSGSRPFALLSQSHFILDGTINANAGSATAGPGGGNGASGGGNGAGPGGGVGDGNGAGGGGFGGAGGTGVGAAGGPAYGDLSTQLQGGSGGGRSTFGGGGGIGGGGGGAVELGASGNMTVGSSGQVRALGANGGASGNDGGGGGSGGGILLHASAGTIDGVLDASAGNGGDGGGSGLFGGGGGGGGRILTVNLTVNGVLSVGGGAGGSSGSNGSPGAVGSALSIAAPTTLVLNEDTTDTVALSFYDVDIADGTDIAQVSLSATNGTLTLATTNLLSFSSGGDGQSSMVFTGLTADVLAAVASVTYDPNPDYFGGDSIVFMVDDQGNFGAGGILSDTFTVTVTVVPVNDAPSFTAGANLPPYATTGIKLEAAWASAMSIGPANEAPQNLTFILTQTFSTGTLNYVTGPAINSTTGDLTFEIAAGADGIIAYDVTLMDDGGIANGGVDTSAPALLIIAMRQGIVYVDVLNNADVYGQTPPTGGSGFFFGIDAFAVVQDGVTHVADSGNVVVASGTYDEADVPRSMTLDLTSGATLTGNGASALRVTGGTVIVNGGTLDQQTAQPAADLTAGDLTISSGATLDQSAAATTIQATGNVTLDGVFVRESSSSNAVAINLDSSATLTFSGAASSLLIRDAGGTFITSATGGADVDASGQNWAEDDGGVTNFDPATRAGGFAIEDRLLHAIDDAARGFVRIEATTVYVTQSSGSIQRGVNEAASGDTLEVDVGLFTELVVVDRSLNIRGAQFGVAGATRFPVVPAVETIVVATNAAPATDDLFRVDADDITIDGFVLDGDAALGVTRDARSAVNNDDGLGSTNEVDNLLVINNVMQNLIESGVSLANQGNPTGGEVSTNLIREFGASGVAVLDDAFLDVRTNTIDATGASYGIRMENFTQDRGADTFIDFNTVTSGIGTVAIEIVTLDLVSPVLVESNVLNADAAVASQPGSIAINLQSVFGDSIVEFNDNTIGAAGGTFESGIYLWDLPTSNSVLISGGTISNSQTGILLESSDPVLGAGGESIVLVDNLTVNNTQNGIMVRAADVGGGVPIELVELQLTGGSITSSNNGVVVETDSAITATVSLSTCQILGNDGVEVSGDSSTASLDQVTISVTDDGITVDDGTLSVTASSLTVGAIGVTLDAGADLTAFANNTLSGFTTAIFIDVGASSVSAIADNSFSGAGFGIDNQTGVLVDATDNWWDTPTGPTHASSPGGSGPGVSSDVDFSPWWASGVDSAPGTPGFQGGSVGPSLFGDIRHAIPTHLEWITQPPNGNAGITLVPGPRVRAHDNSGVGTGILGYNWDGANGDAFLSFSNNPTGASLQGQPVIQAVDGIADFNNVNVSTGGVGFTVFVLGDYDTFFLNNSPISSPFNINNFFPTLDSISPTFVQEGSGSTTVQVDGNSGTYNSTTQVRVNGSPRPTFFVNPDRVLFALTPADTASPGVLNIDVLNPSPGGGTTASLPLVVNDIPDGINLPTTSVAENLGVGTSVGVFSTVDTGPAPDSHTYTFVFGAGSTDNGSFTISGNTLQTAASFDFETKSSYSIRVRSTDTRNAWVETIFIISVVDVNEGPTALPDSYTVNEDGTLTISAALGVLANDTDPEGGLSAVLDAGPSDTQTFNLNANGSFTLQPDADYFGPISFTYHAFDGTNASSTVTVSITVNPVNDAPTFTLAPAANSDEDLGPQSFAVASAFNAGAANETDAVLAYEIVSNSNPSLFSTAPAINTAGDLTYTAAGNASGVALLDVRVRDNGGTANGGVDVSATQQITITINPVNDAPSFTVAPAQQTLTVLEDSGVFSLPGWAAFSAGPADESGQAVSSYNISNISNTALFSVDPAVSTGGTLTFTPAANANGSSTFDVTVTDNGGGATDTSGAQTFTIFVTAVNDAPTVTVAADPSVAEDAGAVNVSSFGGMVAGPTDESGQGVVVFTILNLQLFSGLAFTSAPAIDASGTLTFQTAPDSHGSATFQVRVQDNGGTANGGVDTSALSSVVTITVTAVNDPPTFLVLPSQSVVTVAEDSGTTTIPAWAVFNPGAANESDTVSDYNITNISNAALFTALGQPDVSNAGTLSFTPAANAFGSSTFDVSVADSGTGSNTSATQTFTIVVNAVNDAPTLTDVTTTAALTGTEDIPHTIDFADLLAAADEGDVDGDPVSFRIDSLVSGSLTMNGNPVVPGTTVFSSGSLLWTPATNDNGLTLAFTVLAWDGLLASASPAVDVIIDLAAVNDEPTLSAGTLAAATDEDTFLDIFFGDLLSATGATDVDGSVVGFNVVSIASGSLQINEGFGFTAYAGEIFDGSDELRWTPDPNVNGLTAAFNVEALDNGTPGIAVSSTVLVSVTVNEVNDEPTLSPGTLATPTNEDTDVDISLSALLTTTAAGDIDGTVVGFNVFTIVSGSLQINEGSGFTTYAGETVDGADVLRWTPDPNANGTLAAFTVEAVDNGTPGSAISLTDELVSVVVNAVNDDPSFTANTPIPAVDEDSGAASFQLVTLPSGFNPGGGGDEAGQTVGSFNVTNVSNPALFNGPVLVDSAGLLTYTPDTDNFGSSTFDLTVTDSGGATSVAQTFTITVTPVNDAPSFIAANPVDVLEDAGAVTQNNWAAFTAGPANESSQSVQLYDVSNISVTLGSLVLISGPTVDINGNLSFEAAPDTSGTATFDVFVVDNGGAPGNTSGTQSFTLTVLSVNDEPSFAVLPVNSFITRNEDTNPNSIANWAVFSSGAADETQTATYLISNVTDPSLFSAGPAVSPTGTLTFTLALNANGITNFRVTVQDNGLTANGGDDLSQSDDYVIIVNAVNDAPTISTVSDFTGGTEDTTYNITFAALESNADEADVDGDPLTFRIQNIISGTLTMNGNPVVPGTTVFSAGQLEWTPDLDANGLLDAFTVSAWDGLLNSSTAATVRVDIAAANDAPVLVSNTGLTVDEGDAGTVITTAMLETADAEDAAVDLIYTLDAAPTNGTVRLGGTALSATDTWTQADIDTNQLTYDHDGTDTITDSFAFHVNDANTPISGRLPSAGSLTFLITINPVNDAPLFNSLAALSGATEDITFIVTHADLVTAASVTDPDGVIVDFRFEALLNGTLTINGGAAVAGVTIISAGDQVEWTPPANQNNVTASGDISAFSVRVHDGTDVSTAAFPVDVDVTPVNDTPSISAPANTTVNEDSGTTPVTAWATMLPGGGTDEAGQNAVVFTVTNVSNPGLFSAGPTVTAVNADGDLSFTLNANAFGVCTFDLTVTDDGTPNATSAVQSFTITVNNVNDAPTLTFVSTMFGGPEDTPINVPYALLLASANENDIDSSPINFRIEGITVGSTLSLNGSAAIPGTSVFTAADNLEWTPGNNLFGTLDAFTIRAHDGTDVSSTPVQVRIFIEGVNDEPDFAAGIPPTSLEDAGQVTVLNWAAFNAGPNETTIQTVLNYTVSGVTLMVTGNLTFLSGPTIDNNGNLHYEAAPNTNGSATFMATVRDTGGTASGGDDTGPTNGPFTITVTAVNDAPDFTTAGNPAAVLEDSTGATVPSWITSVDFGPIDEDGTQGVLDWLIDQVSDPSLFSVQPDVVAGELTYTPAANAFGTSTFRVRLQDNGGGTAPNVDTSAGQTFTITVDPVNDAPSVTGGSSPTVAEDAGAQSLTGFVGMNPGPANESGQAALAFTVINLNLVGGLTFSSTPSINAAGTLSFTATADSNGSATFQVAVQDNGGTTPGVDTSAASATFTITVTPVNDAPTMTTFSILNGATEDTAFTITYADLQAAGNDADIDSTPVNFRVESVLSGTLTKNAIPVAPGTTTIAATESLVWTPASNANGVLNAFTLVAFDGSLASAPALTAQVSTAAVNDPPSFTKGSDITVAWDQGAQSIIGWATGISAGPTDEAGQGLTFNVITNNNPGLFTVQPAISSTGTLSFTPAVNASGTAAISIELQDNAGGNDTSAPQAFNITITTAGEINLFRISGNPITDGATDNVGSTFGVMTPNSFLYTIENLGNGTLNLTSSPDPVQITGTGNCEAFITHQPVSPIAASGSTTFVVWVRPLSAGGFNVNLSIPNSDAGENPYDVTVSGTAVVAGDIEISRGFAGVLEDRATDHLGSIPVGAPASFTYVVRNIGTGLLTFGSPAISVISETNCTVSATPPTATIAASVNDSMVLDVQPSVPGAYSFVIQVDSDDPDEPSLTLYCEGTATISAQPELELFGRRVLSPADTEDTGLIPSGSNTTFLYEVRNVGSAPLTVTGNITITNAVNAVVVVTIAPGASVATGQMTPFGIDVQPFTPGAFSFDFQLVTNDADESPLQVHVQGQATASLVPEIALDRDGASIPNGGTDDLEDLPGSVFSTFVYRIRNEGTSALTVNSPVRVFGETNCVVRILRMPIAAVAPQDDTDVLIGVMPIGTGAFSAILRVDSDDSDEGQYFVNLIGTGPQPDIQVEFPKFTPQVNGAILQVGNRTSTQASLITLYVRNVGTGPLSITSVSPSLETNVTGAFVSSGATPIPINGEIDLVVSVTPTASGAWSVTFTITTNDPDTPNFDITIEGTGVPAGSGGGDGGDDSSCSTGGTTGAGWLLILGLLSAMAVVIRSARRKA